MTRSFKQSYSKVVLLLDLILLVPVGLVIFSAYRGAIGLHAALIFLTGELLLFYKIISDRYWDIDIHHIHFAIKNKIKFWLDDKEILYRDVKNVELRLRAKDGPYLYIFLQKGRRKILGLAGLEAREIDELLDLFREKKVPVIVDTTTIAWRWI